MDKTDEPLLAGEKVIGNERDPGWSHIEQQALGLEDPRWPDDRRFRERPGEHEIELSKAISLKRIADALTGTGDNMLTIPLNAFGESFGEAISGQLFRFQRGDER